MLYVLEMTPTQIKAWLGLVLRFVVAWWILLTVAAMFADCYRTLFGTSSNVVWGLSFVWLCAWWMPRSGAQRCLSLDYEKHYREQA